MSLVVDAAILAAGANAVLLAALGWVWLGNYREHGADHTLGLLVFAAFLLVENLLWLYLYLLRPEFSAWVDGTGVVVRVGVALLCGLELLALVVLARVTWR